MKSILIGTLLILSIAGSAFAWDGFDADSADLVEISPDKVPNPGDSITVKNYDTQNSITCVVESIRRNSRTIEVIALYPDNTVHTLVMEGR